MAASDALFESFEGEFLEAADVVRSSRTTEDARDALGRAERALTRLESVASHRPGAAEKVTRYRADVKKLTNDLRVKLSARNAFEQDAAARRRDAGTKMHEATLRVEDARRKAVESEAIGAEVMNDLRSQRESILRSKQLIGDTQSHVDDAEKFLQSMHLDALASRGLLYAIIVIHFFANLFVMYHKWFG